MPPSTNPAPMPPASNEHQEGDNTTLMGILAYLGPLIIIPFVTAKDKSFVHYHLKQGAVLFAAYLLLYFAAPFFLYSILLLQILSVVNLGFLALSIIGIINVVNKKEAPLPLIGQFAKHMPF